MPTSVGNFFIKTLVNSPLYPILGDSFAVITVTGCRSGKPITTPINAVYVDGILSVVSMRERTWWRNLRKVHFARLSRAGKRFMVRAEIVEDCDQVTAALEKYFSQFPGYAKYFKIHVGSEGKLDLQELMRLASDRVIVRLYPL
jgi:deazaflavin-dependent oxidoreductase (nitroreductase family)